MRVSPVFMSLHQDGIEIAVNMSQVTYMTPSNKEDLNDKTVLYFGVWCQNDAFGGEPLYLIVDESLVHIANRREWHQ